LVFDSYYDSYRGVVAYIRIKEGQVKKGDKIKMMSTGKTFDVTEVGIISPTQKPVACLYSGDVGYLCASMKEVKSCRVGDTITNSANPAKEPLPGYKKVTSMVFCGIYPAEGEEYNSVRDALEKLQVNDASLTFEPETSVALGFGFRCGFLGLLHMEIIQERLEREFDLNIIATTPSVIYKVYKTNGEVMILQNPTNMPPVQEIEYMEEPIVAASIMSPTDYVGAIMELCQNRRGTFVNMEYLEANRVILHYKLPLNEVIYDFFDALKSKTRGYASLDYELDGYVRSDLVKMDILINFELVDAFSIIVHEDKAYERGRSIVERLKDAIPRHLFAVPLQAAIGNKVIARETVKALRKDVLAKCYGGDISRKKKLLEKQKEGKKRMRQIGMVEVPQEAFLAVLKFDED
jgi:GTP-binding protein LepA